MLLTLFIYGPDGLLNSDELDFFPKGSTDNFKELLGLKFLILYFRPICRYISETVKFSTYTKILIERHQSSIIANEFKCNFSQRKTFAGTIFKKIKGCGVCHFVDCRQQKRSV